MRFPQSTNKYQTHLEIAYRRDKILDVYALTTEYEDVEASMLGFLKNKKRLLEFAENRLLEAQAIVNVCTLSRHIDQEAYGNDRTGERRILGWIDGINGEAMKSRHRKTCGSKREFQCNSKSRYSN